MIIGPPSHASVSQRPTQVVLQAPQTWHLSLTFAPAGLPNGGNASITTSGGRTVGMPRFRHPDADNEWDQVARLMEQSTFRFLADEPELYREGEYDAV